MSLNRENVTWESADGTWNMAFFVVAWQGSEADGYDPEWDVEYDYDKFDTYVYATKQPTADAAWEYVTSRTANPGGGWVISRRVNIEDCDKYDAMLAAATGVLA